MSIRITLRPHKEGIAALERAGFEVEPVRFGKGDHLVVRVCREGACGQTTISGSPRGSFLGSLISSARRAVREAMAR